MEVLLKKEWFCIAVEGILIIGTMIYAFFAHNFSRGLRAVNIGNPDIATNIRYNLNVEGYESHLRGVVLALLLIICVSVIFLLFLGISSGIIQILIVINSFYIVGYIWYLWDPIIATAIFALITTITVFLGLNYSQS